jgi:probable HAF family extracellular repeat protein
MPEVSMYTIEALYGPYSAEFGVNAAAEANGLNNQSGVAGAAYIPTFDPIVGEVQKMVGATWQGNTLTSALPVGIQSDLYSLNDGGVAVGVSGFDNSATQAAILVSGGNTTDLTPVVGQGGIATGINNAGLVCGWAWSRPEAFVYSSSTNNLVASIPPFAGQDSAVALAINSADEVVGTSGNSGFCFNAGTLTPLGPAAFVEDINDAGIACGSIGKPYPADFAAAICDVRTAAPMFQEIPLPPGAIGSHGDAINRLGDVVGTSWTAQTSDTMQQSAYIFHNGVSTDLNTLISAPGWHLTFAQDINDAGQITGYGTLNGISTAFLLGQPRRNYAP